MNDTQLEIYLCQGIQKVLYQSPRATFKEAVNATVEAGRNAGLLTERMRVRAFFTLPNGQLYVDVRIDTAPAIAERVRRKTTKTKAPSKLA